MQMAKGTVKKRKKWPIVLLIILLIIGLPAGLLVYYGRQNNMVMYDTIANGLQIVEEQYTVTELDPGEYKEMRMYGIMKFRVNQYRVEELGNLSVMTADMGMMQMVSFMITPFEKEVPLCTLDFMYILGNRKSYVEFYDLAGDTKAESYAAVLDSLREMTKRYDEIEDLTIDPHWYDDLLSVGMHKQMKKDKEQLNQDMFYDALRTYIAVSKETEKSSDKTAAAQLTATQDYSNGLIEKGGVSTDVFKKAIGEEKTRDFFDNVFFGTAAYR